MVLIELWNMKITRRLFQDWSSIGVLVDIYRDSTVAYIHVDNQKSLSRLELYWSPFKLQVSIGK